MFVKTTEQASKYDNLEKKSISELLQNINKEDQTVAFSVQKVIPEIEKLVLQIIEKLKNGGRLFYIGAGTSGRLGIVDASECPPTFGVSSDLVNAIIAGGDKAIRKAVEFAEDNPQQAWNDLLQYNVSDNDFVIGIAASGTTPYVVGGIEKCNENNISNGCITCNQESQLSRITKFPIVCVVGSEFITGSSRMKAGTAQKMILNMISTSVMIALGRIKGNKMVDMQLSNQKLIKRGVRMIMEELCLSEEEAQKLLDKHKNIRKIIEKQNVSS